MMKHTVVLCALLGAALAEPNGLYHQEYNYRTSSSSYRNNELQRQNDEQGFYSKSGDLEGRLAPKVNAHSQHSEYVNPKLREQMAGGGGAAYNDLGEQRSSYGQLSAQNQLKHGEFMNGLGAAGSGYGGGYGYSGASSFQGSNYHQSYGGINSNLRQITHQLEMDLARELQQRIQDHHARAYSTSGSQAQMEQEMRFLEEELRRNVTMRMQDALAAQYGTQGIRGSYSYSIVNGRLQPTANYHSQELTDLTRQIEANLMRRLEETFRSYYRTSSHRASSMMTHNTNGYHQPMPYPNPAPIQQRPHIFPIPIVPTPDSITTIATRVQGNLDNHLNKILRETQHRFFSSANQYQTHNYDQVLAQLQQELRENITLQLNEELRHSYGQNRYSISDFETFKSQIERNLVEKLTRDFNKQRDQFVQTYRHGNVNQIYRTVPMHYYPADNYVASSNQIDWANMQRRTQEDLSRELQAAVMQQQWQQAQGYASNYNPQANYQLVLDRLTAELNRNLTRQMEYLQSQHSAGAYAHSSNYDAQLAQMRNQLQNDLHRQLQQGLQQSFSRWSSWSSSSSSSSHSSNYRPARGFDSNLYQNYGTSSNLDEDCMMGDDPSVGQQQVQNDGVLEDTTRGLNHGGMLDFGIGGKLRDHGQRTYQNIESHITSRHYYVTDASGNRREVDADEYAKLKNKAGLDTLKYYVVGPSGARQEIDADEYARLLSESGSVVKQNYLTTSSGRHVEERVARITTQSQVSQRYFITDSSGIRKEVDAEEYAKFRKQHGLGSLFDQSSGTSSKTVYYAIDSSGNRREVDAERYQQLCDENGYSPLSQLVVDSAGHQIQEQVAKYQTGTVNRKYYITDSNGKRREVDAEEYGRYERRLGSFSPSNTISRITSKITRRYYITDASGDKREVSVDEYDRLRKLLGYKTSNEYVINSEGQQVDEQVLSKQARTDSTSTAHYYIIDSTGKRRQVDAEEYAKFQTEHLTSPEGDDLIGGVHRSTTTTTTTKRYYVTDASGNRREVDADEFERLQRQKNYSTTQQYVVNSQGQQVEEDALRIGSVSTQVTRKYYIIDATGQKREVDAEEYARFQTEHLSPQNGDFVSGVHRSTTTTTTTKRYFVTDASGTRREVDAAEFERLQRLKNYSTTQQYVVNSQGQQVEEDAARVGSVSTQVTRKYYIIDATGNRREVDAEEYARFQQQRGLVEDNYHRNPAQVVGTTRTYYMVEASGATREIDLEEYERIVKSYQRIYGSTATKVTRKYYIVETTGIKKEVSAEEYAALERRRPLVAQQQYVINSSGQTVVNVVGTQQSQLEQKPVRPGQKPTSPGPDSTPHGKLQIGQHPESDSLTQQTVDTGYGKLQRPQTGQQLEDLTQQTEDDGYGRLQQPQSGDLTQQTVDTGYGKLVRPGQNPITEGPDIDWDATQQVEDVGYGKLQKDDLTQQVEDTGFGKLQVPQSEQRPVRPGQKPTGTSDHLDLTQQTEDVGYGQFQLGQRPESDDLTQQTEDVGYGKLQKDDLTQQVEDTGFGKLQVPQSEQRPVRPGQKPTRTVGDLTQQTEDVGYGQLQVGQRPESDDLTQQTVDTGFGRLQQPSRPGQTPIGRGQEPDHSDLTQQTEDVEYGQFQVGQRPQTGDLTQQTVDTGFGRLQQPSRPGQKPIGRGQEPDHSDLTQQTEDVEYGQFQVGQRPQTGDLTQQTVDSGFGRLQQPSRPGQKPTGRGQEPDHSNLTQQTEDVEYGQFQVGQRPQSGDLTQQTVDTGFGRLQQPSRPGQKPTGRGQEPDHSDLTQQTEDVEYGQFQVGQRPQSGDLTQQTVDTGFGRLQQPSRPGQKPIGRGQEPDHSDLTQQTEDVEYGQFQVGQRPQSGDLTQQTVDTGFGRLQQPSRPGQKPTGRGQEPDHSDLTQQTEDVEYGQFQVGQRPQSGDLTQQTVDTGFGRLQQPSRPGEKPTGRGQEPDHSDLTQQTEDVEYGQFQVGQRPQSGDLTQQTVDTGFGRLQQPSRPGQKPTGRGQEPDHSDLTQQTEDVEYGQFQVGQRPQSGDLTQQTVDTGFGRLQQPSRPGEKPTGRGQEPDHSDLTQQTEDVEYGQFQVGQRPQSGDLTQQTVDTGFGRLQQPSRPGEKPTGRGQEPDHSDLTQQTEDVGYGQKIEDVGYGKLQVGQRPDSSLTQQTINTGYGKLRVPQQQQQLGQLPDHSDLTQQTEDIGFGKLHVVGQHLTDLSQQSEDLTHPLEGVGKQVEDSHIFQQSQLGQKRLIQQPIEPERGTPKKLTEAEQTSNALLEALRRQVQENHQSAPTTPTLGYRPRPVYSNVDIGGEQYQVPVGTTRGIDDFGRGTASGGLISSHSYHHHHDNDGIYSRPNQHAQQVSSHFTAGSYGSSRSGSYGSASGGSYGSYQPSQQPLSQYTSSSGYTQQSRDNQVRPDTYGGYSRTPINYAHQVQETVSSEELGDLETIKPQRARLLEPSTIKTSGKLVAEEPEVPQVVEELTTTEKSGFWSRFGNKVKDTAHGLKEKIVG